MQQKNSDFDLIDPMFPGASDCFFSKYLISSTFVLDIHWALLL